MKDVQARMREMRAKEDLKRQDSYLEGAYREKLSQEEQEAEWDPIEHVIENERGNYIDLIKHIILMMDSVQEDGEPALQAMCITSAAKSAMSNASSGPKPSSKSKKSKQKVSTSGKIRTAMPDKSAHDTKSQVRKRLREGVKLHYGRGMHVVGTIDTPTALRDRTATVPDEEFERILGDMAEIKHLLLCRLLRSHVTVLPAAIRANSIEEFLNYAEATDTDLRNLALRMDNPGLQVTRDACADLGRGNDEEEEDHYDDDTDEDEAKKTVAKRRKAGLQGEHINAPRSSRIDKWAPDREKKAQIAQQQRQSLVEQSRGSFDLPHEDKGKTLIDFGELDDDGMFKSKKMRVLICGRYIYNYPSERAVTRGGWLQFRDIKPGEGVYSIWDEIQHGRGHVLNLEGKTLVEQLAADPDASKFYNEADLLEDAVLFPEELNGKDTKAFCRGKVNDMERFLNSGPDWVRFMNDMDTDEELENTESLEEVSQYFLKDGSKDKSDYNDGIDAADTVVTDKKGSGPSSNRESITGPLTIPEEVWKNMLLLSKWKPATPYGENVDGEFWTFMDREKSRAFKKSWHAGDLALGADQRRREADVLVKQMAMYQESG